MNIHLGDFFFTLTKKAPFISVNTREVEKSLSHIRKA